MSNVRLATTTIAAAQPGQQFRVLWLLALITAYVVPDRVDLHSWTDPGSVRGAVDFIAVSHYRYNLADIVIIVATLVLGASLSYRSATAIHRRLRTCRAMPAQPRTVTGSMSRGAASRNATGLLR